MAEKKKKAAAAAPEVAAAPRKGAKKARPKIEDILKEYDEPTYFKVKLLGDRYYDHYLHRAGDTIVMLIDPSLKPPRQLRILGEAQPNEVDEDDEEETEESGRSRGGEGEDTI